MMTDTLSSINPSTGQLIAKISMTDTREIPAIVNQARDAYQTWRQTPISQRAQIVTQAFASLAPLQQALAELISLEMGKDINRSLSEVAGVIHNAQYIADDVASALTATNASSRTQIQYQPLGVAAVISPWNYPMAMAANLIIPALVAGNAVVFKPSEQTPLVAAKMVAMLNQHLPDNLLQIIQGRSELGQTLVEAEVNLIAFTGSMAAGKDIMARASSGLKRLIMELGGNDPMIVMDSADINAAARFAVASSFENAGQMCVATERIYVDEKVADQFEVRVTALAKQYRSGPWNDDSANIGPLVNTDQYHKVKLHISDALAKGATLLTGGAAEAPFIAPTVIANITPEMLLEQQETFGPVVAIARYDDVADAIRRANDSEYGLGAVVFGQQGAREVANQLEAGMVGINQGVGGEGDSPWVGAKQSGFGYRNSIAGHRQFAQVKVLTQ